MRKRRLPRNLLFSRRRFTDDAIILCVRWYLRFKVSYRDLAEIAMELGLFVAPSTIVKGGGKIYQCGGAKVSHLAAGF